MLFRPKKRQTPPPVHLSEEETALGNVLVTLGMVSRTKIHEALKAQERMNGEALKLGEFLLKRGEITAEQLSHALACQERMRQHDAGGVLMDVLKAHVDEQHDRLTGTLTLADVQKAKA